MENIVNMKRLNSKDGKVYVVKIGMVTVQFDKERAEYICRMLAHWLGFTLVEKHKIKNFDDEKKIEPNGIYIGPLT